LDREARRQLVEWEQRELPISLQAQLLGLNRTALYYQPVPPSPGEIALKHRIDELYTSHPYYGYRRITAQLQREDQQVNHKAVARHMREMGLATIYPGPNLSKRARAAAIYPYLLANITANAPNHIWGLDVRRVGSYGIPVEDRRG